MISTFANIRRGVAASASTSSGASTDLLTLNVANDGTPGYKYWDINDNGFSSATYLGAFRLPDTENTGADVDFFYALPAIGITSSTKMLVGGHAQGDSSMRIAEINIPALSTSSSLSSLNRATYSTAFFNPVDAAPAQAATWGNGPKIMGIKKYNGRVMVQVYPYYDGSGIADKSICVLNDASAPSTTAMRGFFAGTGGGSGVAHSSVWCSEIPAADKAAFGGTHVMGGSNGNAYRSVEGRNSMGPTLFVYDADQTNSIVGNNPPANGASITYSRKMDFSQANVLNGSNTGAAGQQWDHCSEACYGFLVPNTDTYMVLGFDEGVEGGSTYYDPADPWGGGKGYGPLSQGDVWNAVWFFRKSEILAASNVYDPVAYERVRLILPFEGTKLRGQQNRLIGADFDISTNKLWLALEGVESYGIPGSLPIVLCYDFSSLVAV